jgi:lipopolysaccharide transport system ATP-binding protein
MTAPVLKVDNVSKKFTRNLRRSLRYGFADAMREITGRRRRPELREAEFWAVQNVSLRLEQGQALGLIGANGSGKTTLLRIISGLIRADAGEIRLRGRVAPLLALGAGFNPVLTGRENIFVNMAILGLRDKEIRARYEDVVGFAELEDAIEAPVGTYSSGMAARLGFSCAIHTTPDLLLVDEVLSVGDMRFRAKCYRRLAELKSEGVAFILVSHAVNSILSLCDSVLYLSNGVPRAFGNPAEVVARYEGDMVGSGTLEASGHVVMPDRPEASATGLNITELFVADAAGKPAAQLFTGEPGTICVGYRAARAVSHVAVMVLIRELSDEMDLLLNLNSERDGVTFALEQGIGTVRIHLPICVLRPAVYTAKVLLISGDHYVFDAVETYRFRVESRQPFVQSKFHQPRRWTVPSISTMK